MRRLENHPSKEFLRSQLRCKKSTLDKIENYVTMAREKQAKAAKKFVKDYNTRKQKAIKLAGGMAGAGVLLIVIAMAGAGDGPGFLGLFTLVFATLPVLGYLSAESSSSVPGMPVNKKYAKPLGWDDMVDIFEGDDD